MLSDVARIQEAWLSCCSTPVQKTAEAALLGDQSIGGRTVHTYRARRDLALRVAQERGLKAFAPGGAFYLMVDVSGSGLDGLGFARQLLRRHSVRSLRATRSARSARGSCESRWPARSGSRLGSDA